MWKRIRCNFDRSTSAPIQLACCFNLTLIETSRSSSYKSEIYILAAFLSRHNHRKQDIQLLVTFLFTILPPTHRFAPKCHRTLDREVLIFFLQSTQISHLVHYRSTHLFYLGGAYVPYTSHGIICNNLLHH